MYTELMRRATMVSQEDVVDEYACLAVKLRQDNLKLLTPAHLLAQHSPAF